MNEQDVRMTIVRGDELSLDTANTKQRLIRVAAYCRVSTFSEEQNESLETQKSAYAEMIRKTPNYVSAGIYADRGASGGSTKGRTQFLQMMNDCRMGRIDIVLTKSISRFARNLADTLECIQELKALGIPVLFDKEGIDTSEPSSEMLLGMLAAISQEEIVSLSQNIKWSLGKSSSRGNPKSGVSYGFRKHMAGDTCVWKVCEPEARRIRLIFKMAECGERFWKIVRALQEIEDAEKTGIVWDQPRVSRYLKCESYIGDVVCGKTVTVDCLHKKVVKNKGEYPMYYIEDHHKPLISRERFERVRENLKSGVLKSGRREYIPTRYRTPEWKRAHGIPTGNNNLKILAAMRNCGTVSGNSDKCNTKCVYGLCPKICFALEKDGD